MIQAAKFIVIKNDPKRGMNCCMTDGTNAAIDVVFEWVEWASDSQLRKQFLEYLNVNMKEKKRDIYIIYFLCLSSSNKLMM